MKFDENEVKRAILGLAGATTAAADQASAMTDRELGELLTSGRWSTIEVHEAGRRLVAHWNEAEARRRRNLLDGPGGEWYAE